MSGTDSPGGSNTRRGVDLEDPESEARWDDQQGSPPAPGHYDYDFLLRADWNLRLYFFVCLLPLPYAVFEMVMFVQEPHQSSLPAASACVLTVGPLLAFVLQRWPPVAAVAGYMLFAFYQFLAIFQTRAIGTILGLGGVAVLVAAVVCFFLYRDTRDQIRHRRFPSEIQEQVGRLWTFRSVRAWVELQREADAAEHSAGWNQAAPERKRGEEEWGD